MKCNYQVAYRVIGVTGIYYSNIKSFNQIITTSLISISNFLQIERNRIDP